MSLDVPHEPQDDELADIWRPFNEYASYTTPRDPHLIGLVGFAGVGKDEVAKTLEREHGYTRLGFADPLRAMLEALDPWLVPENNTFPAWGSRAPIRYRDFLAEVGYEEAKRTPEVRRLLQKLGTEAGRGVLGDTIWIDHAMQRVNDLRTDIVITDCRFPNEAEAIRNQGGYIVLVHRPGYGPVNNHESERLPQTIEPDFIIYNDGWLDELDYRVGQVIARLAKRPQFIVKTYSGEIQ